MTNTEINTIRGDKIGLEKSHYVDLPSEIYDEYDTSYNSKKSKRFVFNKRIEEAPKVEKFDIEGKTATQLLALYNSLPLGKRGILLSQLSEDSKKLSEMYLASDDKEEFLKAIAKNTPQGAFIQIYKNLNPEEQGRFLIGVSSIAYSDLSSEENKQVNQVIAQTFNKIFEKFSKTDKKRFITNFSATLKQLVQDTASLSEKEKAELNQYIVNLNKTSENNPYFGDSFDDPSIGNIMMVLIRAFNDNMTTEGLDQISQINDTKLINKFLQVAQSILQKNLANEQNVVNNLDKKSSGWRFWTVVAAIALVAVVCIVLPELLPEATPAASDVAAGGSEMVDDTVQEMPKNPEMESEKANSTMESVEQDISDIEKGPNGSNSTVENEQETVQQKKTEEIQEDADDVAEAQRGDDKTKEANDKENKSLWDRFKTNQEVRIQNVYKFLKTQRAKRILTALKIGVPATIATYFIMRMINPNWVPHGKANAPMSAKDSASLQVFQTVANYENNVINQNNNIEQTTSKRIGDDSEKISQASGFVQQAINMFGQAYSFRA